MNSNEKSGPLVSVIIPAYNAAKHLSECISSVAAQTYSNIEIIVVDDGSTDMTLELSDAFAAKDSRITVIQQSNQGVSAARNNGMETAHGNFIMFVDSDDFLASDCVAKRVERAWQTKADMVYSLHYAIDAEKAVQGSSALLHHSKTVLNGKESVQLLLSYAFGNCVWSFLFSKQILDNNHIRFNENIGYGEDMLFLNQVFLKIKSLAILNSYLYYYRLNGGVTASYSMRHAVDDWNVI